MANTDVTITLSVPEALYALNALGRQVVLTKAQAASGDEWLDATAQRLYESAQRKLEVALYPEPVGPSKFDQLFGFDH